MTLLKMELMCWLWIVLETRAFHAGLWPLTSLWLSWGGWNHDLQTCWWGACLSFQPRWKRVRGESMWRREKKWVWKEFTREWLLEHGHPPARKR